MIRTYSNSIVLLLMVQFIFPQLLKPQSTAQIISSEPIILKVKSHDPNFKGFKNKYLRQLYSSGKSFYKQKDQWRHIIDSMWGPGLPTAQKLQIFDDYTTHLHNEFDGFQSLGMSWVSFDSLKNYWRSKINDTTSRGGFAAIMSYFAITFRDCHTYALDTVVVYTPLNPGVPVLLLGAFYMEGEIAHFGAVLTSLPDSNLLVLRTVDNHPLNLQPGDIILGYEGIHWKDLVHELMNAEVPLYAAVPGSPSAYANELLIGAGINWHLFDTNDVIQHSTGDTLHLSLQPMADFVDPPIINNEQLAVPGIQFPVIFNYEDVSFGTITGTNIGYIYLIIESNTGTGWPPPYADEEFYNAVLALKDKDALIIDMRYNLGGRAFFPEAFRILFNRSMNTLKSVLRCSAFEQMLCDSIYHSHTFEINGEPPGFDRPIAILIGPNCGSFGDITAYRLRYHDMARYFGKSATASMGWNTDIKSYQGWLLHYSIADQYHSSIPGSYLNRKEYPIDYPVWFNPDDVANGIDPVVQKAVEWINNSSYAHNVIKDKVFYRSTNDTIILRAEVENPNSHPIAVTAYYRKGEEMLDSSLFYDDGLHDDSIAGDGVWGTKWAISPGEYYYSVNVSTVDLIDTSRFLLKQVERFTTIGPVAIDSITMTRTSSEWIKVQLWLRNQSEDSTIYSIRGVLKSTDTDVKSFGSCYDIYGNLLSGQRNTTPAYYNIKIDTSLKYADLQLILDVSTRDEVYWTYDLVIPLRITPVLSKNNIDYGVLNPGENKIDSVILRNPNNIYLNVLSASTDFPTQYSVLPTSAVIAPLDSQKFYVTFSPTVFGIYNGHLIFTYDGTGSPVMMNITGTYSPPSVQFTINEGWNIVSLPMQPFHYEKDSVFSTSVSPAYTYINGYNQKDTLSNGKGYWLKYSTPQMVEVPGIVIFSDTFDVGIGWNMIGSITYPVLVSSITSEPSAMVTSGFYRYVGDAEYAITDTIKPGYGYWVKTDRTGLFILSSSTTIAKNRIRIILGNEIPPPPPGEFVPAVREIPKEYALEQAYPNPFNPSTTIRYEIPDGSFVVLKVFNVLGQDIKTLINEYQDAGFKEVDFDATALPSGLYFYRLQAGKYTDVKKMLLMR